MDVHVFNYNIPNFNRISRLPCLEQKTTNVNVTTRTRVFDYVLTSFSVSFYLMRNPICLKLQLQFLRGN